jgi:cytochrome P450
MTWMDASHLDEGFERLAAESIADPRPFYTELREQAPVYRTPFDFWYVTRYDLAVAISRDDTGWTVSKPPGTDGRRHDGL